MSFTGVRRPLSLVVEGCGNVGEGSDGGRGKALPRCAPWVGAVFDGYAAMVSIVTPATIAPTIIGNPADG